MNDLIGTLEEKWLLDNQFKKEHEGIFSKKIGGESLKVCWMNGDLIIMFHKPEGKNERTIHCSRFELVKQAIQKLEFANS